MPRVEPPPALLLTLELDIRRRLATALIEHQR